LKWENEIEDFFGLVLILFEYGKTCSITTHFVSDSKISASNDSLKWRI